VSQKKGRVLFLKKRTKKLLLVFGYALNGAGTRQLDRAQEQKFFASFFKKISLPC
jgi:hypothetical protein